MFTNSAMSATCAAGTAYLSAWHPHAPDLSLCTACGTGYSDGSPVTEFADMAARELGWCIFECGAPTDA